MSLRADALDDALAMRSARAELLSLALMEARNLTLRWLSVFESRGAADAHRHGGHNALWLAGHAGWYQECWIARNLQRARGRRSDPSAARLASIEPEADAWFMPDGQPPGPRTVRGYLVQTMETTLDLLAGAGDSDEALHFYRAALLHEDRIGEALAELAATLHLPHRGEPAAPFAPVPARAEREPLFIPAGRQQLGSMAAGFVPDAERGLEEVAVPEFEIDAQPVSWQRYGEFVADGGYERAELWTAPGWAWAQQRARRAPRDVESMRGGVLLRRGGELQRAGGTQPAMHLTRHEAQAWCTWAGRRLPSEPEWELAARVGRRRGFVFGDVFEWTAGSARAFSGHAASAGSLDRMPVAGSQGVLRGASFMTPARQHHIKARRFLPPGADHAFVGFRSCAL